MATENSWVSKSVLDQILIKATLTQEEINRRINILKILELHFVNFLADLCFEQAIDADIIVPEIDFKICPYGSYGIGLMEKDSDLDAVLTCSQHRRLDITREAFFEKFFKTLQQDYRVKKLFLLKITPSYQIKFEILGVDIDLVFAITRSDLVGVESVDRMAISALKVAIWFQKRFGNARSNFLKV